VKAETVMKAYTDFARGYRSRTMASLSAAYKDQLSPMLTGQERIKELAAMVYQQVDKSRGHELKFWKAYNESDEVGAMQMAKTACQILSIQATSASSERAFSKSGLVIRKHRARLSNAMGCALIKTAINISILDD
jgi:hAT family C-terminal dimerisation region